MAVYIGQGFEAVVNGPDYQALGWIALSLIVSQVIRGANNLVAYLAYAAGFAAGNYVGIYIENRLAIGTLVVRAIVQAGGDILAVNEEQHSLEEVYLNLIAAGGGKA